MIANTPAPPYYAVIFSAVRTDIDNEGYEAMNDSMAELAKIQPGYLGHETAGKEEEITVSFWDSVENIKKWKAQVDHQLAQKLGREKWYSQYKIRICKVEHDYGFEKEV